MKQPPLVENPELGAEQNPQAIRNKTPFDSSSPRKSRLKTFFKVIGIFLLVSGISLAGYVRFTENGGKMWQVTKDVVPAVIAAKTNPGLIFDKTGSDVVNILLIGRDVNWKIGKVYDPKTGKYRSYQVYDEDAPARSDTMIVVSLDRARNEIHMVSLPRDARVHMPPNKYHVGRAKLNAAHAYGGPELLKETIYNELGLTIHHYAVIRFEGFKKLIDQMHGIEVDVIGALKRDGKRHDLVYNDDWGNLHINLKPGKQILDGQQAHNYVRFRMDLEGDPGRIRRQQQVMRSLAKSLMHQPIYRIAPLVQEVRKQFKTDMSNEDIASAADFAKGIGDASKIQPVTMFGVYGTRGSLILNKPKNIKLFNYLFGTTFDETRFLQNSPSTENDEMGEENNSSPDAQAILRHAGLIKGVPGDAVPARSNEETTVPSNVETSSRDSSADSYSPSRLAVSDSESDSTPREQRSRRRERRERDTSSSARQESRSRESGHTPTELSVPSEDAESSSEESTARESSGESPVPQPEAEHSDSGSSSPVPRGE